MTDKMSDKYISAKGLRKLITQKVFKHATNEYWGVLQAIDEMPNERERAEQRAEEVVDILNCMNSDGRIAYEDYSKLFDAVYEIVNWGDEE